MSQYEKWKNQGESIVFTNGCFDLLHYGHIHYLQEAKKLGDRLVLGLNSDSSVRELKGQGRPISHQDDRKACLLALSSVDEVIIFDGPTPIELIKNVRPELLIKGGDYDIQEIVGKEFVESYGGKVKTIPFVEGRSTSQIIEHCKKLP